MAKDKKKIPYSDDRPYRNPEDPDPYKDWPEETRSTADQLPENWMSKAEEQLRFVIRFSQLELDNIRQGDLINLIEDLGFFMWGHPLSRSMASRAGAIVFDEDTEAITELPIEKMKEIQKEAYELLNIAASLGKASNPKSILTKGDFPIHRISVGLRLLGEQIGVFGSSRDCFIFVLYRLLTQETGMVQRITLCPGCGRIFYRVKRQKYCSQRCSNRMYMQQYRAKNGKEVSESNHKQYEKRTKEKIGKAVRIGRRPRRK